MMKLKISIALAFFSVISLIACTQGREKVNTNDSTMNTKIDGTANAVVHTQNFVLIPGKAAGKTKINEDSEEVFKVLGKPDSSDAAMQKIVAFWYSEHDGLKHSTSIYAVRDSGETPKARVQQIRVTSPQFKTGSGLGVNSSLAELKRAYKLHKIHSFQTTNNQLDVWDSNEGIAFEIDNETLCTAVIIHHKGEELKGTYLPLR